MKQRRNRVCGMRDGTANDLESNGCRFKNNLGYVVNHAGMQICRGKSAPLNKRRRVAHDSDDFPTPGATTHESDNNADE